MKLILNLALAVGLVLGTANAASAASLESLYNRYVAPTLGTPYIGNPYGYGGYYGYGNPYANPYGYGYPTSYYGYNNPYYNPYYGYNYGARPLRGLGNLLNNWF